MASWGDVNRALNGLVAEGVIGSFTTNIRDRGPSVPLKVTATPGEGDPEESRRAVIRALARLGLTAQVEIGPP